MSDGTLRERSTAHEHSPAAAPDKVTPVILFGLAIVAAAFILQRFYLSTLQLPLDYNEGWNAYNAMRLADTGTPYPAAGGLTMNNYPPLWFPAVVLAKLVTSSYLMAARLVATGGFVLLLACVTAVGGRLRGTRGAIATLVVTAYLLGTQATHYIGIADPQFFAQGVSAMALVLCAYSQSTRDAKFLGAIAVAVLAGFIKHNLAALPLALMIAAALDGKQSFLRATLVGGAALVVGYLASSAVGGFGWPVNLLSARKYFYGTLVNHSLPFLTANAMGIVLAIAGTSTLPSGAHVRRVLLGYFVMAMPIAIGFVGGYGVGTNIFYDSMVAMALSASLVITGLAWGVRAPEALATRRLLPPWAGAASVAVWLVMASLYAVRDFVHGRTESYADEVVLFRSNIEFVKSIKGDAVCEQLSLCYLAGKPFVYDPFNANQALATGKLSPARVRELLAGRVNLFHYGDTTTVIGGLPAPLRAEIDANFEVLRRNTAGVFLVRRGLAPVR